MYHPFFRGKQYELLTIRENATLLKDSNFTPIVEPVKESLTGLVRALGEIVRNSGKAILIVNPDHGDCDAATVQALLENDFASALGISVGILIHDDADLGGVQAICRRNATREVTLIHAGYTDGSTLASALGGCTNLNRHVFLEEFCGKLYRKHFKDKERVLIRDGFQRRINREHPPVELFSDLHVTFPDEGMDGFGDFLVVGDDFSEGGGPAYAIAIHVTFIDHSKDDAMFIHHFVSDRTDTPTDPAGKFAEALSKLIAEASKPTTSILRTHAIAEFFELHNRNHFPGLGYVKKLSMQHHLETLADHSTVVE